MPFVRVGLTLLMVAGCGESRDENAGRGGSVNASADPESVEQLREILELTGPFNRIRNVGIDNGVIYVLDLDGEGVFRFSADGAHLGPLGARGQGPGEFSSASHMTVARDSVWVLDMQARRITIFPGDGRQAGPVRTFPLQWEIGRSPRGSVVLGKGSTLFIEMATPTVGDGANRSGWSVVAAVRDDGVLLADSLFAIRTRGFKTTEVGDGALVESLPFGHETFLRAGPDGMLYEFWNGSNILRVFDNSGKLQEELQVPIPSRPVARDDLEELRGQMRSALGAVADRPFPVGIVARLDHALAAGRIPDVYPSALGFDADGEGNLWFQPLPTTARIRYSPNQAYSYRTGREVTSVARWNPGDGTLSFYELQGEVTLLSVQDGLLIAVAVDQLGVETVRVYEVYE